MFCGDGARRLRPSRRPLCCWLVTVSTRFVVARALGARRVRAAAALARAQAGEVEQVREHHLHAGRPVGAVEAQAVGAAVEAAVRVRAAAPREDARLEIQPRSIGLRQHISPGAREVDRRLFGLRERMLVAPAAAEASAGATLSSSLAAFDRSPAPSVTPSTRASVVCASVTACRAWISARLRGGAFGVGARRFGARPQLIVHQRVRRASEHLAAIHIGLRPRRAPAAR